ncbi:hypothetical protein [Caproiciproducens sp.]
MAETNTFTVLQRLKMELGDSDRYTSSDKNYMLDDEYIMRLAENGLADSSIYDYKTMKRQLLQTVSDVLSTFLNNIEIFRSHTSEFETQSEAYDGLQKRLNALDLKIASIPDTTTDSTNTTTSKFMPVFMD